MIDLNKKRYSIPARIMELLYTDDNFFNEVLKIKKLSSYNKFPKSDEWCDEKGFNLSFALAGYSPKDITIEVEENTLIIRGDGLDNIQSFTEPKEIDNEFQEYAKEGKPQIHSGIISRGIARRKFCVKYFISEEFDLESTIAEMEHGLLHISIPEKKEIQYRIIDIKGGL